MLEGYCNKLLRFMRRKASTSYRLISLLAGAICFLLLLPFCFFVVGSTIDQQIQFRYPRLLEILIACVTILFGLFFLLWATSVQWRIGKGTPAPNAPTQKLVVVGPYKLCRNPIELGAICYHTGIGTLFGTLTVGIICGMLGFIIGTLYHKLIEEKELALRFGQDYLAYKKQVPFLFPTIRKPAGRS
jgi:protein-S-isoprenylcysteine O-methyltransferase Ste14